MELHQKQKNLRVRLLCLSAILFCAVQSAYAEKADSLKETQIDAENLKHDGKLNITTLTGDVVLTRGTLVVRASRAVLTELGGRQKNAQLFSSPGKLASFRQKRDGGENLWVEGEAERIEYNDKTEEVKFISKAKIRYLEGKKVTQEQEGEFLSYDSLNDVFLATNTSSGQRVPGAGRVKLTIQPKTDKPTN